MKNQRIHSIGYRRKIYLLTVSVCLLVVSAILWFLYAHTRNTMLRRQIESNDELLEQSVSNIDYMVGILNATTYSIYNDTNVRQLMYMDEPKEFYDYIRLINTIADNTIAVNPAIHSTYVYNEKAGTFFSTYRGMYYLDEDFAARQQAQQVFCQSYPILRDLDGELVCTQAIIDSYTAQAEPRCSVFVNYRFDWMLNNMNVGIQPENGETLLLVDNEGKCIDAAQKNLRERSELGAEILGLDGSMSGGQSQQMELCGTEYLVSLGVCNLTGWRVYKLVPLKAVTRDIRALFRTLLLVNLIAVAAVIALYYGVTQILYRPVNKIISMLPETIRGRSRDEFSLVESYYLQQLNEIRTLRKTSETNRKLLEEPIVNRLLYQSHRMSEREFAELYQIYRFHISFDQPYQICVLAFDQPELLAERFDGTKDKVLVLMLIRDIIRECVGARYSFDYAYSNDECMTVLLQVDEQADQQALSEIVRQLQKTLAEKLGSRVSAGLSSPLRQFQNVSAGYRQAMNALQYRMVYGKGSVISQQMLRQPRKALSAYDVRAENQMLSALENGQYHSAVRAIAPFVQELAVLDISSIQVALSLFISHFKRMVYTRNEIQRVPLEMERIAELLDERSIHYLEELPQLLGTVFEYLESAELQKPDPKATLVEQACAIVAAEFSNPSLSASYLADQVGVTAVQLGKLFKKHCGKTIPEYITDYRLEKAVAWMKNSNLTVSEIAQRCGYQNESYFFRVFKEKYGITPRQYEKQQREGYEKRESEHEPH